MRYLIDTNVAIVANGKSNAGPACVIAAIERLERLIAGEILILDDADHIVTEYRRHLSPSGQPGTGDQFYRWLYEQAAYNPQHCEKVTLATDEDGSFTAFPKAAELARFDLSDRKFVAAALTHHAAPPVVNASDTDWHEHREALKAHGVVIEFICPEEMAKLRNK
ncbi:PIN domain-containing protein [Hymenobacter baengnokdamensis]|uniref:PIN domain-containing protein n=1 Tax=Hymenobacter baengnokdamensis TaxID=2615203 RepID=UPI0012477722|nr:PIN domain-containing protein [Hymenobacter baengnokdamensis]